MNFLSTTLYRSTTLQDLLFALLLIISALFLIRVIIFSLKRGLREHLSQDHLKIILKVFTYLSHTALIVLVMPYLGVNFSALLVAGGVFGIAVGFASQNILNNFFSGVFLMFEHPIKIGQAVSIDGVNGVVEDIRIMSTTLRSFEGLFIRIPNQKVFTSVINNFVANPVRRFEYVVGIRYSSSSEEAVALIKRIIAAEPYALIKPEPLVFVDSLDESAVKIKVRVWAPVQHVFSLRRQLLGKIKEQLYQAGFEVPLPQRILWHQELDSKRPISSETSTAQTIPPSEPDPSLDMSDLLL